VVKYLAFHGERAVANVQKPEGKYLFYFGGIRM
jgi:hypothetical protein